VYKIEFKVLNMCYIHFPSFWRRGGRITF